MEKKMLIDGMKCMHCKASVESALKCVAGVTEAEVDLEGKTARIIVDEEVADDALMGTAVFGAGGQQAVHVHEKDTGVFRGFYVAEELFAGNGGVGFAEKPAFFRVAEDG